MQCVFQVYHGWVDEASEEARGQGKQAKKEGGSDRCDGGVDRVGASARVDRLDAKLTVATPFFALLTPSRSTVGSYEGGVCVARLTLDCGVIKKP